MVCAGFSLLVWSVVYPPTKAAITAAAPRFSLALPDWSWPSWGPAKKSATGLTVQRYSRRKWFQAKGLQSIYTRSLST